MQKLEKEYAKILKTTVVLVWLNRICSVPVQLLIAGKLAGVVSDAVRGDVAGVGKGSAALILLVVGWEVFSAGLRYVTNAEKEKSLHKCKMETYARCMNQPLSKLYDSGHGEILERMRDDAETVMGKLYQSIPLLCAALLAGSVYFGALFIRNSWLAVIFFVMAMVQMLPPMLVKGFIKKNYDEYHKIEERITEFTVEGYRGFLSIKMYALKRWYLDRLENLHRIYLKLSYAFSAVEAVKYSMDQVTEYILKYGACLIAGVFALRGSVSAETGIYAITLSSGLFGAVKEVFSVIPTFSKAQEAAARLAEWESAAGEEAGRKKLPQHIRLDGVSCSRGGHTVLSSANCTLDTGDITVMKGSNGAGKSTLLKLLAGLLEKEAGDIMTWGHTGDFFYVPQERIGMDITGREFMEMASLSGDAGAAGLFREFGVGDELLDRPLSSLSGGEEKKFFLALGMADQEATLFLDEPVNSLDSE